MVHKGSCHCGQVTFEVEGTIDSVLACNCSICRRKGSLLWFVPREQLRVTSGEGSTRAYTFNKHVIKHHFCPTCGMHPFGEGSDPKGNRMGAVNVRCLPEVELEALKVQHFNGRDL